MLAAVDTGETNGLVIIDEAGGLVRRAAVKDLTQVYAILGQYRLDVVVIERCPATQQEYQVTKWALLEYGYEVVEVSPGQWKPNPQYKCPARNHKGWTKHERDAMSMLKWYWYKTRKRLLHSGGKA